jgi:hypothetical protein
MAFVPPTAEQLGLFLALPEIDGDRADLLIEQALALCETVVRPLPDQATAVVLSVAGRAYVNPQQVSYETIGPMSVQRPPGIWRPVSDQVRQDGAQVPGGTWGCLHRRPDTAHSGRVADLSGRRRLRAAARVGAGWGYI